MGEKEEEGGGRWWPYQENGQMEGVWLAGWRISCAPPHNDTHPHTLSLTHTHHHTHIYTHLV